MHEVTNTQQFSGALSGNGAGADKLTFHSAAHEHTDGDVISADDYDDGLRRWREQFTAVRVE
jgi:hypothetical protein